MYSGYAYSGWTYSGWMYMYTMATCVRLRHAYDQDMSATYIAHDMRWCCVIHYAISLTSRHTNSASKVLIHNSFIVPTYRLYITRGMVWPVYTGYIPYASVTLWLPACWMFTVMVASVCLSPESPNENGSHLMWIAITMHQSNMTTH
jgi:hypothetical protein